jgi:Activator of Hsp90 ATPase homolog 1-like protein
MSTEVYFAITRHIDASSADVFRAWGAGRHAPSRYREVAVGRRLVFDLEPDGVAIVTFAEHRGGTALTFEGSAEAVRAGAAEEAWTAVLDGLAGRLAWRRAGRLAGAAGRASPA